MAKHVYAFTEGDRNTKDLLGRKGTSLAEMVKLDPPVPPGFTITTGACCAYPVTGESSEAFDVEVMSYLCNVEQGTSKCLGGENDSLFVSVRSGMKFSMSGMMETVLNIDLNDEPVQGLVAQLGNERFAWGSYRRLIQMFGKTVRDVGGDKFADTLHKFQADKDYSGDLDMTTDDLKHLVEGFKKAVKDKTGGDPPQNPRKQLDLAAGATFRSWNTERAHLYRRCERIPNELGTMISVYTVVSGNMGETSGTGMCFTQDPSTGRLGVYGGYPANAQGEDVAAGIRDTLSLANLEYLGRKSCDELRAIMNRLEMHYCDLCDIELIIQRSRPWMLQTRAGKRTPTAAFRVATQLADERLITSDEAVTYVTDDQLTLLFFLQFDKNAEKKVLIKDMPASSGAAAGKIVLNNEQAASRVATGASVILVRRETNPDDFVGMIAASGVLTARGGKTSHAAVVARGMGRCCVAGTENLAVDEETGTMHAKPQGITLKTGDVVAIDGTTGEIFQGEVPVIDSPAMTYIAHGLDTTLSTDLDTDTEELVCAVDRIPTQADEKRDPAMRANADTLEDTERVCSFSAQSVGLCRIEHMFLGDRRKLIESVVLTDTTGEQEKAFDVPRPLQKDDFVGVLAVMDGLPVTVRLIDPLLHEFLPDLTKLSVELTTKAARGEEVTEHEEHVPEAVKANHKQNPMPGLCGVYLDLKIRDLFKLQIRAIAEIVVECKKKSLDPRLEIMAPFTDSERELQIVCDDAKRIIGKAEKKNDVELDILIGSMIELPRAALETGHIAVESDSFSFGTGDLTQTTQGFSCDDVEASSFSEHFDYGIFGILPSETIDASGVGQLIEIGVTRGRAAKPGLKYGVCGGYGGDPASIRLFDKFGLNYVSCSLFRVPAARLESGRATIFNGSTGTGRQQPTSADGYRFGDAARLAPAVLNCLEQVVPGPARRVGSFRSPPSQANADEIVDKLIKRQKKRFHSRRTAEPSMRLLSEEDNSSKPVGGDGFREQKRYFSGRRRSTPRSKNCDCKHNLTIYTQNCHSGVRSQ